MHISLAPMEGVINHVMRDLLTRSGALDRCVTEFVRVNDRLLPPRVFHRYCPELLQGGVTPAGTPVYLQLLGGRPQVLAENAAQAAALGAPGIDLNFGCPAKTVNRSDGGSILLREPERVHQIVHAVRQAVPAATPVTVKIRLGYENTAMLQDNVEGIAAAGATELAVHARTKVDGYRPPAWWEEIARVRSWVDLPVVANGEIWSPGDARRCLQVTGCDRLMLGRGMLRRPDLADLLRAEFAGAEKPAKNWAEVQELLLQFFQLVLVHYDPPTVGNPVKQWLAYLRGHYPQAGELFERVKRLRSAQDIGPELARAA